VEGSEIDLNNNILVNGSSADEAGEPFDFPHFCCIIWVRFFENRVDKIKTFGFMQAIGGLFWAYMDLSWIWAILPLSVFCAVISVFFNIQALIFALLHLKTDSILIKGVVIVNLWMIMGGLWTISEFTGLTELYWMGRFVGLIFGIFITWEFLTNRENIETLGYFMGKHRIR